MIPKKSLEKKLNVQIATSGKMDNAIQLWLNMYQNTPPWIGGEKDVKGLNLPAIIAEEMSRLVLTEFDIQLDGSPRAEYILEQMSLFLRELNHTVEMWCALGGIVLKPYAAGADEAGNPDHIEIDVIQATRFYPTAFDSNKDVTGAVFIDTKRIGDHVYTRLEYHSLVGTHYTVTNKAFRSERIISVSNDDDLLSVDRPFSEEIPLEQVDDWKGIESCAIQPSCRAAAGYERMGKAQKEHYPIRECRACCLESKNRQRSRRSSASGSSAKHGRNPYPLFGR